jgi:hypothetical protein
MKLQATINKIDEWAKKWRIKINQSKSTDTAFILRNQTCRKVQMGNVDLPQKNEAKCLGMHLHRRLTWSKHIKTERRQVSRKEKQMYWLLRRLTL